MEYPDHNPVVPGTETRETLSKEKKVPEDDFAKEGEDNDPIVDMTFPGRVIDKDTRLSPEVVAETIARNEELARGLADKIISSNDALDEAIIRTKEHIKTLPGPPYHVQKHIDKMTGKDAINPSHYQGKVQSIDGIEAAGHGASFCIGSAEKYLFRLGKKDSTKHGVLQDLKKVLWYTNRVIKQFEEDEYECIKLPDKRVVFIQTLPKEDK